MRVSDVSDERWQSDAPVVSASAVVNNVGKTQRAREAMADPVALSVKNLTADGQQPTRIELEAAINEWDVVDANYIQRCRLVMDPIARLQVDTEKGRQQATGFIIAPGLLMTNHHVLPDAMAGVGGLAQFGCWHDVAGGDSPTVTFTMEPEQFYVSDKELDFAVIALSETSTTGVPLSERGYLKLNPGTGKTYEGRFVTILQHPDGAPMQIALRENKVITASQDEFIIRYSADTAHGSSGAPVFNDSFQLAALHSGGRVKRNAAGEYLLRSGEYVANIDDRLESEVVWDFNVGIRISRICAILPGLAAAKPGGWHQRIVNAMGGGDVLSVAVSSKRAGGSPIAGPKPNKRAETLIPDATSPMVPLHDGAGGFILPLKIKIGLGDTVTEPATVRTNSGTGAGADSFEAASFQIPVIYDNLEGRSGFDRKFLNLSKGKRVPMPKLTAKGKVVVANLLGSTAQEIKYHKFSVWMHAQRRLALMTASNVDWRSRSKTIDGKDVDRETLCGFPPKGGTRERWVTDARLDARHQLPDVFFTKDYYKPGSKVGAFDKGHIVRRDDVCWGDTFADIQMANGDTFHVTNCSPQISIFNQAPDGLDNWGDLENLIQSQTGPKKDRERVVVFAGPVFGANDRWFGGVDDDGPARVQIPGAYWKIVVNKQGEGAGAYGFILKQNIVPFTEAEFRITSNWTGELKRISDIEKELRGWLDLSPLKAIDRYDDALANIDKN